MGGNSNEDHFVCYVAAVLKRLPNRTKATARLKMLQVLLDAKFSKLHAATIHSLFPYL